MAEVLDGRAGAGQKQRLYVLLQHCQMIRVLLVHLCKMLAFGFKGLRLT